MEWEAVPVRVCRSGKEAPACPFPEGRGGGTQERVMGLLASPA